MVATELLSVDSPEFKAKMAELTHFERRQREVEKVQKQLAAERDVLVREFVADGLSVDLTERLERVQRELDLYVALSQRLFQFWNQLINEIYDQFGLRESQAGINAAHEAAKIE